VGIQKNIFRFVFIAATIVYIIGLFVDVINVDAAQYASISKEMLQSGSYLIVKHCGMDYLDKPPLLFWLSALSFKIFGIYNWSYKLPSFLFTLLGVFATYRLAKSLYDERVGKLAALLLYTCQAFFMFNNDVRTDTILTTCVITSIWLLYEFTENKKWQYLIGGSVFIALGMMAKGPIGIMVPALALGSHFVLKKKWRQLFRIEWLVVISIVLLMLLPMCYGLYEQYGWQGVKFFFWTQSFGRITGENVWRNDAGYFFFMHTFLWSFMPWSLLAVYALGDTIVAFIKRRTLSEYVTIGGFLLTFIAMSMSKYKLPHYIFVVFPLIAILTAEVIETQIVRNDKLSRVLSKIHLFVFVLYVFITGALYFVFSIDNLWLPTVTAGLLIVAAYLYYLKLFNGLVIPLAIADVALNFALNSHLYPHLLQYQPAKFAAEKLKSEMNSNEQVYYYENKSAAFDFYFRSDVQYVDENLLKKPVRNRKPVWIYSETKNFTEKLTEWNMKPIKQYEFDFYHIQFLNWKFLNPKTRNSTLKKAYLVQL